MNNQDLNNNKLDSESLNELDDKLEKLDKLEIAEILNDQECWCRYGLKFFCMGCGRCCRGEPGAIFFNQQEFNIIAKTLGISRLELREKYVTMRWGRPSFKERPNGDCIFYNSQKARCMIYPVRPTQCRTFPFWPEVLKSRESWDKFASRCPGMNEGELFLPSRILDFVEECNSWFEDKTGKSDK